MPKSKPAAPGHGPHNGADFLDHVLDCASIAIATLDLDGRFTFVNAGVCELTGYAEDELLGKPFGPLVAADALPAVAEAIGGTITRGLSVRDFTTEVIRKDGLSRWISFALDPLSDETGAVVGIVGTAEDVTESRRLKELLISQEERYERLWETSPDAIVVVNEQSIIVAASPVIERVFGYAPEELAGQELSVLQPEHLRDMHRASMQHYMSSGERRLDWTSIQIPALHRDGHEFLVEISFGETNVGGERVFSGFIRDVTARVQAEAALSESESRYRALTENTLDLVCELGSDGRFVYASPNFQQILGYEPAALIGQAPFDFIHEEDRPRVAMQFSDLISEVTNPGSTSFRFQRADGSWCSMEVSANLFEPPGGERHMVIVARDLSARQQAESLVVAQRHLLEMIAAGSALEDVFQELVVTVESQAPGTLSSILLLSSDGARLQMAAAPSLPDAYNRAIDGVVIGPEVGSCGTAAFRNEIVVVTDIQNDPLWREFKGLAAEHNLRACWSAPIRSSSGTVLGTLAMYYRETRAPTVFEQELIGVAAHIAGIAIERRHADQSLRSRTAELERMYGRLARAHSDLEESKQRLEEKSRLIEKALESERERSRRDQLTGSLNHMAITDVLREIVEAKAGVPHAIAMVDVDGLKVANDTYGHQVGDAVLVKVAATLARSRATVGRYGGDEFVVILPGADRNAAERFRDEALAELAAGGLTDPMTGANVPVIATMGIAIYPDEAATVEDLIRLSDGAMYQERRQRATVADGSLARPLGGDRAARMVGELVPLLTSPGNLQDKLRLVAHRLSIGAGYDAVNFVLSEGENSGTASSSFARVPDEFLDAWNHHQRGRGNLEITRVLERTKRPLIMDDISTDEHLDADERELLAQAGLQSALVAPMIWESGLIGILTVASTRQGAFGVRDAEFVTAVATQVTAIVRMSSLLDQLRSSTSQLQDAHEGTVLMLAKAAEAHDATTGRHLARVREISIALGGELGYDDEAAKALGIAATLHDIGKIRVPDSVLGSAESLAEAEWVLMKQHTIWGGAFLAGQQGFELAASVARHHHERWDGAGYPDGLAGEAIPEPALITTVADSLDAMTSNRPYRLGRPLAEAVDELVRCSGTQFSPRVVEALVRLHERGELSFVDGETDEPPVDQAA
jgi:PAS domain S-box-containing protein/diguanylate cyclase (GGDEF)-like protein